MFASRHALQQPARTPGLQATIVHPYDDGIKEITPGDPDGPSIHLRMAGKKMPE
jgi:hypothetical protein